MTYPTSLPSNLDERKLVLSALLTDMEDAYGLSASDLRSYVITTSIVPENLQVDLLIHSLDLYQSTMANEELFILITGTLDLNHQLVSDYRSGNSKAINSLVGKVIKQHPNLNPAQVKTTLTELI